MKTLRALAATLALLFCSTALFSACGTGADEATSSDDSLQADRRRKNTCNSNKDCHNGQVCQNHVCQNPPATDGGTPHPDAGTPPPDAGTPPPPDAGTPPPDAGTPPPPDAGTPPPDAGTPPPGGCANSDECANGGLCNAGSCSPNACNQRQAGRTALRATVTISSYGGVVSGTANGSHEMADGTLTNILWIYDAAAKDTNNVHLAMNVASSKDPAGLPHEIPLTPGQVIEVEGEYIPAKQASGSSGRAVIHFTHSGCGFVDINGVQYR